MFVFSSLIVYSERCPYFSIYIYILRLAVRDSKLCEGEISCTCLDRLRLVSSKMGTGFFPGVKRPGRDLNLLLPFSPEVKETVDL